MEDVRRDFIGRDGFVWFIGVVEDRNDPLQLGRARVRVFGWHTNDLLLLPTESLPWALVLSHTNQTPVPPLHGDWVAGFFIDGEAAQQPVILGVLPGFRYRDPKQVFAGGNIHGS